MKHIFALALMLMLIAGCSSSNGPSVSLVTVKFEDATALETTAKFTLRLSNENADAVHITGSVHKIYLNGLYLGKGLSDQTVDVPRLGTITQDVTVHLSNLALATRLKSIIESKSFEYRVISTFHGKSWSDRMSSQSVGKLELKDLVPEFNETNAPPAEIPNPPAAK